MNSNDSTTLTVSEVYNDVKEALNGIANALKVGAEHVYEILLKQQIVSSVTLIMVYIVTGIVAYLAFKMVFKVVTKGREKASYEPWGLLFIIPSIITIFGLIFFGATIQTCITGFLNPEYGALMEIRCFIK